MNEHKFNQHKFNQHKLDEYELAGMTFIQTQDQREWDTRTELPVRAPAKGLPCLAVVIPAYRAQATIRTVLTNIPDWVTHIIVVDDASPDETAAIVRSNRDPRVHLISSPQNAGVGGAVWSGYRAAAELGAQIIVKMDSDDQMDPKFLLPLVKPILFGEADYTKGNRFLHTRQLVAMPLMRRIGNLGLSFLTKLASGYWNIFDPTNGYTAIHASLLPLLDEAAIDRRYFFETSMLLELGIARAVVRDVYIPARYGEETSSLSERQALWQFPARLIQGFLRRVWIHYFVREFGIFTAFLLAGLALTSFGMSYGLYYWMRNYPLNVATPAGTVMVAVLPIILGIQFLLQGAILDIQNTPSQPLQERIEAIIK